MKTYPVAAWQVDEGDLITLGSEAVFRVAQKDDTGSAIRLVLKDDDDWSEDEFSFLPDDVIQVVASLEEDSDADFVAIALTDVED